MNYQELDDIALRHSEEEGFERVLLKYKIKELRQLAVGETMLDVGCGVGAALYALRSLFRSLVGIDGSAWKIQRAIEINSAENISYVHTLIEDYKPANLFDYIVSTNVLEHVESSVEFLARIKNWLSPGGRVVMTVPNARSLHKRVGLKLGLIQDFFSLTEADLSKGHKRIYDQEKLRSDFESAGLRVISISGILLKPLSHKQMESWDSKLVDAFYEVGKELPDWCSSLIISASS